MNKQITIEVPKGKVAKQITNPDGSISILFVEEKPICSRSWNEFCKNHHGEEGYFIDNDSSISQYVISKQYEHKHLLETKKDAEGILALIQLTRLHDEWVEDWNVIEARKHHASWYVIENSFSIDDEDRIFVFHTYGTQHLLSFPTQDMAKEFLDCFGDLIEKAKKFI